MSNAILIEGGISLASSNRIVNGKIGLAFSIIVNAGLFLTYLYKSTTLILGSKNVYVFIKGICKLSN